MTEDRNKGRLLANRYHLIELVGQGAMGQVYRTEDILLGGLTVAVKLISQSLLNEKRRNRFEQEAKICALLSKKSIHIVQVRNYGVDQYDVIILPLIQWNFCKERDCINSFNKE